MLYKITLQLVNQYMYLKQLTQILFYIIGTNCETLIKIILCNSEIWRHECAYQGHPFSQMITCIASFRTEFEWHIFVTLKEQKLTSVFEKQH